MSLLVKTEKDLGIERPAPPKAAPRPKVTDKLMERIDGLPKQLQADVKAIITEATKGNAAQLEGLSERIAAAIEARVHGAMVEIVQAMVNLRAEVASLKSRQQEPPKQWDASVERKDGKITGIKFTPK